MQILFMMNSLEQRGVGNFRCNKPRPLQNSGRPLRCHMPKSPIRKTADLEIAIADVPSSAELTAVPTRKARAQAGRSMHFECKSGRLVGSLALVFCLFPLVVRGTLAGVEVLSASYHISAQWNSIVSYPYQRSDGGYDEASAGGSPVAASTGGPGVLGGASIDTFSFYDWAQAGRASTTWGTIQTSASGVWNFRTAVGGALKLDINAFYSNYGQYGGLKVNVTDLTLSTTLLDLLNPRSFSGPGGLGYSGASIVTLDQNHDYELSVAGWSNTFDGDATTLNVTACFLEIPEPATYTICVLGCLSLLVRAFKASPHPH